MAGVEGEVAFRDFIVLLQIYDKKLISEATFCPHGYAGCSGEPEWPGKRSVLGAGDAQATWGLSVAKRNHSLPYCYAPCPIIIATSSEKSSWDPSEAFNLPHPHLWD